MLETTKPRRADVVSPSRVKIPERIGIIGKTQGVSARSNTKPRKLSISQAKPPSAIRPETRLPLPAATAPDGVAGVDVREPQPDAPLLLTASMAGVATPTYLRNGASTMPPPSWKDHARGTD